MLLSTKSQLQVLWNNHLFMVVQQYNWEINSWIFNSFYFILIKKTILEKRMYPKQGFSYFCKSTANLIGLIIQPYLIYHFDFFAWKCHSSCKMSETVILKIKCLIRKMSHRGNGTYFLRTVCQMLNMFHHDLVYGRVLKNMIFGDIPISSVMLKPFPEFCLSLYIRI